MTLLSVQIKKYGGSAQNVLVAHVSESAGKTQPRRGLILSTVLYYGSSFEVMRLFGVVT